MVQTTPSPLPIPSPLAGRLPIRQAAPAPTALSCMTCQLLGRRRLTCSAADHCAALPRQLPLGPALLAAWLATAIAFVVAVW